MTSQFTAANPLPIFCCGDSTVAGITFNGSKAGPFPGADGGIESTVATPAPEALRALLQAKYGMVVTVSNDGLPGTTFTEWLNGTGGVPLAWEKCLAGLPAAAIVILLLGINDNPADLAAALPRIIQIAEAPGKRLVLQTPNALDAAWASAGEDEKVATIRAQARAARIPLIDFAAETEAMGAAWFDELSYSGIVFGTDAPLWSGIHPTPDGYSRMARAMFRAIDPLVAAALDFPAGTLRAAPIPGAVETFWTWGGAPQSCLDVLDPKGLNYWNGAGKPGVSFAAASGTAGEAAFTLPPGPYLLALSVFWNAAWHRIATEAVTVPPPIPAT